jgi:tRNA pseudouridine55 synthase
MKQIVDGYLLIDKPRGWTSFDIVNKIRFLAADELGVRPRSLKVGHAGTLDPLATGLLIVLIGSHTKKQAEFMKQDKTYEAEVHLGQTSDTDDSEGSKTFVSDRRPEQEEVEQNLKAFVGKIEQIPPQFSAIKIGGKAAYARARAGQKVELKSRQVKIFSIEDISYKYPRVSFVCRVSSGTYVRSLARDFGAKLGTGAYLSSLKRTQVGEYSLKNAVDIKKLDTELLHHHLQS